MYIHTSQSTNIHCSIHMLGLGSDSTLHTQTFAASQGCLCYHPASSICQRSTWNPLRSCIFWIPQASRVVRHHWAVDTACHVWGIIVLKRLGHVFRTLGWSGLHHLWGAETPCSHTDISTFCPSESHPGFFFQRLRVLSRFSNKPLHSLALGIAEVQQLFFYYLKNKFIYIFNY